MYHIRIILQSGLDFADNYWIITNQWSKTELDMWASFEKCVTRMTRCATS